MGVAERRPHRRRRGHTGVWAWLGDQGVGPGRRAGAGSFCVSSRRRASGRGRGGEARREGRSLRPRIGNHWEQSELESVHPAPSAGLQPGPASVRTAAAAVTAAAAALGDPGPAGAARGGGARALDVPQRGSQREKGGRVGLGWGGGAAADVAEGGRHPDGEGAKAGECGPGWGSTNRPPPSQSLGDRGLAKALLYQGPSDSDPQHRTPPQKNQGQGDRFSVQLSPQGLGMGPGHNPQMKPRPPGGDSSPDAIPAPPCRRGALSTTTLWARSWWVPGHRFPTNPRPGGFQADLSLRGVLGTASFPLPPIPGQRPRNSPFSKQGPSAWDPTPTPA